MGLTMPHARVNPLSRVTGLCVTVLLHEHGIGLAELVARLSRRIVEHVVRKGNIGRTPAQLPGIGGQHQDVKPGLPGAVKKGQSLRGARMSRKKITITTRILPVHRHGPYTTGRNEG